MISLKISGIIVAAFIAGAFVASPELRAYAAATIGSADIIDESIQSVDIKNGQVKASDIATDAVTADEIKGVSKLIFAHCKLTTDEATFVYTPGNNDGIDCSITGVDSSDTVIATLNKSPGCIHVESAVPETDNVQVGVRNVCSTSQTIGLGSFIGIIVFDK